MKRLLLLFAMTLLVMPAEICSAETDHIMPGAKDERDELKLPEAMKVMQKKMMRKHLGTIGEILDNIAKDDLKAAALLAREKLGWSPTEEKKCSNVSNISGEPDFMEFGMALHKQADTFADSAERGDKAAALSGLSELISRCNACHDRFRH